MKRRAWWFLESGAVFQSSLESGLDISWLGPMDGNGMDICIKVRPTSPPPHAGSGRSQPQAQLHKINHCLPSSHLFWAARSAQQNTRPAINSHGGC